MSRQEIIVRSGITVARLGGMDRGRDANRVELNRFRLLQNVRHTHGGAIRVRDGEEALTGDALPSAIDGIFDAGAGVTVEAPQVPADQPLPLPAPGPTVPTPPAFVCLDFDAVVVEEVDDAVTLFSPAVEATLLAAISDGDPGTYMYADPGAHANEAQILFTIPDPGIDDDALVTEVHVEVVAANSVPSARTYPPCWMGHVYAYQSEWLDGIVSGETYTMAVQRPGGGPWYGRDLSDPTLKVGVYVVWNLPEDAPRFSSARLCYSLSE